MKAKYAFFPIAYLITTVLRFPALINGEDKIFFQLHGIGVMLVSVGIILHMAIFLRKRFVLFVLVAFWVGLFAELLGTIYGIPFGKYYYNPEVMREPYIYLVPISIPVFWAVLAYISFSTTNLILGNKKLPVIFLSFADGLWLMIFDLFLEPAATGLKAWIWIDNGPYYGVPALNFLGWLFVGFLITAVYRRSTKKSTESRQQNNIPIFIFSLLFANNALEALYLGYKELAIVALVPIILFAAITILKPPSKNR